MTPNPAKVLLIEDDTRAAVSLEKMLTSEGYAVTVSHRVVSQCGQDPQHSEAGPPLHWQYGIWFCTQS